MSIALLYEDFTIPTAPVAPPTPLPEDQRLECYERGYDAGWDDATQAAEEERRRVGAALARRLEEISFSHAAARAGIMAEMRALVIAVGDGVVPALARDGFGRVLAEALQGRIDAATDRPVEIAVEPAAVERIAPLLPQVEGLTLRLTGDATLGEGQVLVRIGREEREIDMQPVIEEARAALAGWIERGAAPVEPSQGVCEEDCGAPSEPAGAPPSAPDAAQAMREAWVTDAEADAAAARLAKGDLAEASGGDDLARCVAPGAPWLADFDADNIEPVKLGDTDKRRRANA